MLPLALRSTALGGAKRSISAVHRSGRLFPEHRGACVPSAGVRSLTHLSSAEFQPRMLRGATACDGFPCGFRNSGSALVSGRRWMSAGGRSATNMQEVEVVDLYAVLGLKKNASQEQIKTAYRSLGAYTQCTLVLPCALTRC